MRLAAAAILVIADATAERGISILEAADGSVSADTDKTNVALALVYGYDRLRKYDKGVAVASKLQEQYPESDSAFRWHAFFLRAAGGLAKLTRLLRSGYGALPATWMLCAKWNMTRLLAKTYSQAHDIAQRDSEGWERGCFRTERDCLVLAFPGKPSDSDVDAALKAAQLSNNAWGILHTLGCLYAGSRELKESREVLVQAMDSANLDDPDSNFWYAFGRVAEQAGERDLALADYKRVTIPQNPVDLPVSSYHLAQIRLKALQKPAK